MRLANCIIIILLALSFFQCETEDYTIDKKKQIYIDTFSTRIIKSLTAELDSLCDLNYDSYLTAAVDSILMARKKEIEKMLKN